MIEIVSSILYFNILICMSLPYCYGTVVINASLSVSPIYLFPIPLLPTWCKHFSVCVCFCVCVCVLIENKLLAGTYSFFAGIRKRHLLWVDNLETVAFLHSFSQLGPFLLYLCNYIHLIINCDVFISL